MKTMKKKNRWYCFLCKQRFPKTVDERVHIKLVHMGFRDVITKETKFPYKKATTIMTAYINGQIYRSKPEIYIFKRV